MNRFLATLLDIPADMYARTFSLPLLREWNQVVFCLSLRAQGYNNVQSHGMSGEKYFIEKILKGLDPAVCVDVGANVGSYTSLLLSACENTRVYAFEPLAGPFHELERLGARFGERLMAVNKGVGSKLETLRIHFDEENTGLASFSEEITNIPYVRNERGSHVEVTTLDDFFLNVEKVDRIDFIKIDTEGFEFEVIQGAKEIIARFAPKLIQIEYNWHHLFTEKSLYAFSKVMRGYDVFQLLPDGWVERDPKHPASNIYEFSNFVFVRKDVRDLLDEPHRGYSRRVCLR
uniref:Methyltransferase, FkbM family n=1 Tax=Candidatus Kentrum sp. FM TaxID=2126340 RepID=A0A450TU84_9GAMM|nr:MAG: methyltransferase, FkbM family [Candidatus Kentron sp. FM]VFJ72650.1 MAG: methyltransferase, FkbM family [Candidatus Kentron sp. FM]VFK19778.1 MAG: methyltransferase, FkbM family [Candidatus Kentron sp. FM]